jgi:hypothetical protein
MAVSGLSVRQFAEAEGLKAQRIYRWRSVLGEKRTPAFVEVKKIGGRSSFRRLSSDRACSWRTR